MRNERNYDNWRNTEYQVGPLYVSVCADGRCLAFGDRHESLESLEGVEQVDELIAVLQRARTRMLDRAQIDTRKQMRSAGEWPKWYNGPYSRVGKPICFRDSPGETHIVAIGGELIVNASSGVIRF